MSRKGHISRVLVKLPSDFELTFKTLLLKAKSFTAPDLIIGLLLLDETVAPGRGSGFRRPQTHLWHFSPAVSCYL